MKFHCDRCKTRYSISDDRVRGKILKIRCKNCSAVISVREGMPAPDPTSTATPRAPESTDTSSKRSAESQVIARRLATPVKTDPGLQTATRPAGPAAARAASNPALQGAFEKVLSSPGLSPSDRVPASPPESYDVEWYVSIDGEQLGPFALADAQDWVSEKSADDELYCWSEGFDDWLPIDKVSHFRNLRASPLGKAEPLSPYMDEKTAIGTPDFEDYPAHMTTPSASAPMPVRHGPAVPLVAAGNGSASSPSHVRSAAKLPAPHHRREAFLPATTPTPQPLFARTLEQVEQNAPTAVEEALPPNGAKKNDLIQMPPPSEDTADPEFDLNVSEASRVVKLPVFAQMALQGRAEPVAPTNGSSSHAPGLPGVGGNNNSNKIGYGSGQFGILRAQTNAGIMLGEVDAPRPELLLPKKRKTPLWIPIGAGALLVGVVTLLIVLATGGDDPGEVPIARTATGSSDLARNYTDPVAKKVDTVKEHAVAEADTRKAAGPRGGAVVRKVPVPRDPGTQVATPTRPTAGEGEVALRGPNEEPVVQGYLDPLEVTNAYRKYQVTIKRCYETALKRDPFLVVPKTQVNISVGPEGVVTAVSIPSLAGQPLGTCLANSIRRWRFKRSTKGLNTAFEVVFKS